MLSEGYLSQTKPYQIKIWLSASLNLNLGLVWYFPGWVGGWGVVLIETKANLAQFQWNFQLQLSMAKRKVCLHYPYSLPELYQIADIGHHNTISNQ